MVDHSTSPPPPTVGQQFTSGGITWTWDGVKLDMRRPAGGGGGIADAPSDGTLYGRKSAAWLHVAHTDITDWTATLAPYALTTSVPAASSSSPLMDGTAAIGTGRPGRGPITSIRPTQVALCGVQP